MPEANPQVLAQFQKVIGMIMHLSMQNFMQFSRSQGISMSQMGALRHIQHKTNCNISEISEEMGISNAASSQLLERLAPLSGVATNVTVTANKQSFTEAMLPSGRPVWSPAAKTRRTGATSSSS